MSYKGSHWDGHNHVGSWEFQADYPGADVIESDGFKAYWDASDWFGPASIGWEELCEEAEIDPKRALSEDIEELALLIAQTVEPLQDEVVSGTEDYAREKAEEWLEEQEEDEDAA